MIIELLQDWQNVDDLYKAGIKLEIDDAVGESLIKEETAQKIDPKPGKAVVVRDVSHEEAIRAAVEKEMKELQGDSKDKRLPVSSANDKDEYSKTGGFQSFAHFAQEVYKAGPGQNQSEPLVKWNQHCKATGLSEGVNADGGFFVPTEFKNTLLKNSIDAAIIKPKTMLIPMQTNALKIPIIQETTRATTFYGGVKIYRPAEAGTKTSSKFKAGQVQLNLHKLIGLVYATDELLEDSPISIESLLSTMVPEAIAYTEDDDFINGTGAGMALGIMNAPCLISVTKETGQAAATIVSQNLFNMRARLNPQGWGRAMWLANQDTYPQLRTLTVNVGTGGSVVNLLGEGRDGVQTLDGIPIKFTDHCAALGTTSDILLCDWSQYLVGEKSGGGLKTDISIHVNFVYDETAFRFVFRYDGQPWWPSALTPKRGATISPFIALATRA